MRMQDGQLQYRADTHSEQQKCCPLLFTHPSRRVTSINISPCACTTRFLVSARCMQASPLPGRFLTPELISRSAARSRLDRHRISNAPQRRHPHLRPKMPSNGDPDDHYRSAPMSALRLRHQHGEASSFSEMTSLTPRSHCDARHQTLIRSRT